MAVRFIIPSNAAYEIASVVVFVTAFLLSVFLLVVPMFAAAALFGDRMDTAE